MLSLFGLGIFLLSAAGRGRALFVLLAIPVYYLCVQSPLHTEYRYTLPIHYFLFVMAAVTLYCCWAAIWLSACKLKARYLGRGKPDPEHKFQPAGNVAE